MKNGDKLYAKRIQWVLDFLKSNGFQKSKDRSGKYHQNGVAYWKKIPSGRYLVFYHFNAHKKIFLQGFDPVIMDMDMKNGNITDANLKSGIMLNPSFDKTRESELEVIKKLLAGEEVDLSGYLPFY